jgi:hypothetical protein
VDVDGHGGPGVAEDGGHHRDRHTVRQHQSGCGVPEGVQADSLETGGVGAGAQRPQGVARVAGLADVGDEIRCDPELRGLSAFETPSGASRAGQDVDGRPGQRDRSPGLGRLRFGHLQLAVDPRLGASAVLTRPSRIAASPRPARPFGSGGRSSRPSPCPAAAQRSARPSWAEVAHGLAGRRSRGARRRLTELHPASARASRSPDHDPANTETSQWGGVRLGSLTGPSEHSAADLNIRVSSPLLPPYYAGESELC